MQVRNCLHFNFRFETVNYVQTFCKWNSRASVLDGQVTSNAPQTLSDYRKDDCIQYTVVKFFCQAVSSLGQSGVPDIYLLS